MAKGSKIINTNPEKSTGRVKMTKTSEVKGGGGKSFTKYGKTHFGILTETLRPRKNRTQRMRRE